jgi:cytochrome P450
MVARQLKMDVLIDCHRSKKGDLVMAPSALDQHKPTSWKENGQPTAEVWYAERFLKYDQQAGKDVFSTVLRTSWTSGKFFPFGGGTHVCPGRVSAKQEILGALATFLTQFDVRGLGKEPAACPQIKQQCAGNGTLNMDGGWMETFGYK